MSADEYENGPERLYVHDCKDWQVHPFVNAWLLPDTWGLGRDSDIEYIRADKADAIRVAAYKFMSAAKVEREHRRDGLCCNPYALRSAINNMDERMDELRKALKEVWK